MTLIKQEKLVFVLVILYIREYLCVFTKLFTGARVSEDFRVSGSRNNQERTALPDTMSWRHCYQYIFCLTSHVYISLFMMNFAVSLSRCNLVRCDSSIMTSSCLIIRDSYYHTGSVSLIKVGWSRNVLAEDWWIDRWNNLLKYIFNWIILFGCFASLTLKNKNITRHLQPCWWCWSLVLLFLRKGEIIPRTVRMQ